jgi:hypothetical protein
MKHARSQPAQPGVRQAAPGKVTAFPATKWQMESAAERFPLRAMAAAGGSAAPVPALASTFRIKDEDMAKSQSKPRIETRIPMEVAVQLRGSDEQPGVEQTFTENVSSCGARVLTQRRWKRDECVQLTSPSGGFRSRARVAYCQPVPGSGYAIGVEFLQLFGNWVVQRPSEAGVQ